MITSLSHTEVKMLNKIISIEEMNGKLNLNYKKESGWYFTDVENNGKILPIAIGVSLLIDEITSVTYDALSDAERFTLIKLCGWLIG